MKKFKYDVVQLIQCVRDRPCLWDKTLDSYKDKVERKVAWDEIFNILDEGYDQMTPEEKNNTASAILYKWTNVRDTFNKTLKLNNKRHRKYILHDHLAFLKKVLKDETPTDDSFKEEAESTTSYSTATSRKRLTKRNEKKYAENSDCEYEPRKKIKKDRNETEHQEVEVVYTGADDSERTVMNEDEAFFASLLPTVVTYNEDERLEFRIEVLSLMKKIKDQRQWNAQII